jgi:hypothetical protein
MASGEVLGSMSSIWEELAAGTAGEDALVEVCIALRFHLPNRRRRDPYVRWCGSCALQAQNVQSSEMATLTKPSQQSGTESCVGYGNVPGEA